MEEAPGEMEGEEERGQRQEEPAEGGHLHDEAVDQAGLGGLVERLPQQDDDEAGDGRGQIEDHAEEDFAARHFLQQDGQQHGRNESQRNDEERVAGGGQQRAPPVRIPQQVGEVVEEHPGRGAENAVVEERHRRAAEQGHVAPEEDGGGGGKQQQEQREGMAGPATNY